jgi:hypothetical protein
MKPFLLLTCQTETKTKTPNHKNIKTTTMKKFFIIALSALFIGTTAFAGPNAANVKVNENFTAAFSKASNVSWKTSDRFEKVTFTLNNEKVQAFYDNEGDLIGTSKTMDFSKLPKSALETITTKYQYPEFQLKDCIQFTNAANEQNYYVSLDKTNETVVLEITKGGSVSVFARSRK